MKIKTIEDVIKFVNEYWEKKKGVKEWEGWTYTMDTWVSAEDSFTSSGDF